MNADDWNAWGRGNTGMRGGGHAHFQRGYTAGILVVLFPVTAKVAHGEF